MTDMSLMEFIGHISKFEERLSEEKAKGFERAAKIVQAEAKREIGTYQDAAWPFVGWAELADGTKDDRVKRGFTENDPGLRTGEMGASIERESNEEEAVVGSNDDKMVWFELGTDKQPPRSVLGMALVHKEAQVTAAIGEAVVGALVGRAVFGIKP